jgi:hypothetical protein
MTPEKLVKYLAYPLERTNFEKYGCRTPNPSPKRVSYKRIYAHKGCVKLSSHLSLVVQES